MGGACWGSVPDSFRVEKIHSVVLGGTRCYSVVLGGTRWYSVVLGGTRWYSVLLGGTLWYSVVLRGTPWYLVVFSMSLQNGCSKWVSKMGVQGRAG
jgi:hypothetical protein